MAERDIVERLRARKAFWLNGSHWLMLNMPDPDCAEAVDEIERLRAPAPKGEVLQQILTLANQAQIVACNDDVTRQEKRDLNVLANEVKDLIIGLINATLPVEPLQEEALVELVAQATFNARPWKHEDPLKPGPGWTEQPDAIKASFLRDARAVLTHKEP